MTLEVKRIKALCFDIDGTLRDTDDQYMLKIEKFLSPLSIFMSKNKISSFSRWLIMKVETPGNLIFSIPDRLGIDDKFFKDSANEHSIKEEMIMVPGTLKALERLSQNYKMAVVSARKKSKVDEFVFQNDLGEFFPIIISALSAKRSKPHPAPLMLASEKLGVPPNEILMVGDTTYDILSGKRAGTQTAGVLSGFGEEKELIASGANIIIESVADLPPLLLN